MLSGSGTFEPGSPEQQMEDWVQATGSDPAALLLVLDTFVNTTYQELATIKTPVLVVTGAKDGHNATARALAETLPTGAVHRAAGQPPHRHDLAGVRESAGRLPHGGPQLIPEDSRTT
jgi:hypothetical protein